MLQRNYINQCSWTCSHNLMPYSKQIILILADSNSLCISGKWEYTGSYPFVKLRRQQWLMKLPSSTRASLNRDWYSLCLPLPCIYMLNCRHHVVFWLWRALDSVHLTTTNSTCGNRSLSSTLIALVVFSISSFVLPYSFHLPNFYLMFAEHRTVYLLA